MFRQVSRVGIGLFAFLLIGSTAVSFAVAEGPAPVDPTADALAAAKMHHSLVRLLDETAEPVRAWVFFADKGVTSQAQFDQAIADVAANYNPRAVRRRAMRGLNERRGGALFDEHDLPVVPAYVEAVATTGAHVRVVSSWVNAVSVVADREQLEQIASLPFVTKLQPVARLARIVPPEPAEKPIDDPMPTIGPRGGLDYGASQAQLAQMNLIALHEAGYTGEGVVVGILDTGFQRSHEAFNQPGHAVNVIAEYDFVDDDPNAAIEPGDPSSQHDHGTKILGCIGSYKPGSLVGGAYNASFVLAKTEDTTGEYQGEEDNYVAGLQFLEANGVDMSTASLGYIDWYTQSDLDGLTAVTTIAINTYTANGVHHCNAAGNEYHDSNPSTSSIIAPADGFQVITCGAVDSSGSIAYFSSDGPTADGRVKPEVVARGVSTHTVSSSSDTGYTTADGTSLSTPLVACTVACLVQARPYWTVDQMRQHLFETADVFIATGTYDPLYVYGYGLVDAFAAYQSCSDQGVATLDRESYPCQSAANVFVNDCGLNTNDLVIETVTVAIDSTSETGVEQVLLTETATDSGEFLGTIPLNDVNSAGVLLVVHGDTVTVTYQDADDGTGSPATSQATAVVDCQPPLITNVQTTDVDPRSASIVIDANEPVRGTVHYGPSCAQLTETATGSGYDVSATVGLTGLQDDVTYFYSVEATDQAGNNTTADNGGVCYTFTTPEVPDYFTEQLSSNDLPNTTIVFDPNESPDFYRGCVEMDFMGLPTDPTGGTNVSLSDDDSELVSLTGGQTVSLYGTTYSGFYVVSNGYLTFGQSDTDYDETLEEHFAIPRVAGWYDDLNPSSSGTVSYKQVEDRIAVTWQNVPEYNTSNSNTFQIELYFDGKIAITYLDMAAQDGIAGLSAGDGLPVGFYQTDLSDMEICFCGPRPPTAISSQATTAVDTATMITFEANDDGYPDPPAALEYRVVTLPQYGTLHDPNDGAILSVPYTLLNNGNQAVYQPEPAYQGPDLIEFLVNDGGIPPEGGDSNTASVAIAVGGSAWTPVAYSVSASTQTNVPVQVELSGNDPNGDPLVYTIESLPGQGHLSDPDVPGVAIETVPYDLPARFVSYHPPCGLLMQEAFTFTVSDATATSNVATATVTVNGSDPRRVFNFPMDEDPGWSTEGDWQYGPATAGGTHNGDPASARTGSNLLGYNLGGDYGNLMPPQYLTTWALDCSRMSDVELRFWRWLGVESYPGYDVDHATVEVSSDGQRYDVVWENSGDSIDDDSWVEMVLDLSAFADSQETVYLRWGMGPTDSGVTYPGWNLDDVEIWGIVATADADFNADAFVDLDDAALFAECIAGPGEPLPLPCLCVDLDSDGDVDLNDFAGFQTAFNE